MLVYNYHPGHGAFISATEADESPLEPGEFLIPAHATTIAPPVPAEGHAAVWSGDVWIEVEDHRGETWWTAEGEPRTVVLPGNPADKNLLPEKPESPAAAAMPVGRLRFALVEEATGLVIQTIEADAQVRWEKLPGYRMVVDEDAEARPGYVYDGKVFALSEDPAA